MVFPIVGGDGKPTGYEIDNSMRFNRGDAPSLTKTFSGSPTSTKICTISFWTKLANPADTNSKAIFSAIKSGSNEDVIKFMGANNNILNAIEINFNNTSDGAMMISSGASTLIKFRDPSAWYHFVIAIDSSQGTASNRVKAYVNGTQFDVEARVEGGSVTTDIPLSQNYELGFLTASAHSIGENVDGSGENYDGYLADFHFVDGQQLAPTAFAETDDNGVWIPKDCKDDLTYGNYGFFLEFQQTGTSANASGKGADTSGNDNHFDDANATAEDITTDTPTNNFATLNPLSRRLTNNAPTYSEGNVKLTGQTGDGQNNNAIATIQHLKSGKWYFEVKCTTDGDAFGVGISDNPVATNGNAASNSNHVWYQKDGNVQYGSGGDSSSYGNTYTDGDIIGVAFDLDNGAIYFYKNGTIQNSGTAARTDLLTTMVEGYTPIGFTNKGVMEFNFGNPPYAISSGNTDGLYGNFEYAPPSGYYALCTKRLARYG